MSTPEHVAGQLDLNGQPVPPAEVAKPNPTSITISIEIDADLSADECWPDGEPEQWGAGDLAALIKREHSTLAGFLRDWSLLDMRGRVTVHDDRGQWAGVDLR